jgi:hypothetical protein
VRGTLLSTTRSFDFFLLDYIVTFPHSRRVDQTNHYPIKIDGFLNHVPRRTRNGRYNRPIFPQETVQQAGFADIRPA